MRNTKLKINKLWSIILVCLLAACTSNPAEEAPAEIGDGLVKQDSKKVDLAYVREGVDWTKFKSVYIKPLQITDEARDSTPENVSVGPGRLNEKWIIPEEDAAKMQAEFMRILTETMEKNGIPVVDTPNAQSLIYAAVIVDITLNAPLENSRVTDRSRGATFTEGAGSMTLAAALADGADYRVIGEFLDKRQSSDTWSRNSRVSNLSDMRSTFRRWASLTAKSLQKAGVGSN